MSDARRERQLGTITPNLQRFEAPVAADWLDAIKRLVCPICGEGPFIVVATHVAKRHGIVSADLKTMLGLQQRDSICDPSHANQRRSQFAELDAAGKLRRFPNGRGTMTSERARAAQGRRMTPEGQARRAAALSASRLASTAERDAEIVRRRLAGERRSVVARDMGVSEVTVTHVVKRSGTT